MLCTARGTEEEGTSILFVSHSGPQIIELCEKALLLEYGERLMLTEPLQAVRAYQKLIYAPVDEQESLLQEYRTLNQSSMDGMSIVQVELASSSETNSSTFDFRTCIGNY